MNELIILATLEVTPLMIVCNVLVEVARVFEFIIVVDEDTPFTILVNTFPRDDTSLVVLDNRFEIDVVATTPLIFEVTTPFEKSILLFVITGVDDVTPLMIVFKVFPVTA